MPYPYIIVYRTCRAPRRHMNAFPKIVTQFAGLARFPRIQNDEFVPQLNSKFPDVDCPSLVDSAVISHVTWTFIKLAKPRSRKSFWKTEKILRLLGSMVQLFLTLKGAVLDPYSRSFKTAIASFGTELTCSSIEQDRQCFLVALERVPSSSRLLQENASCREAESILQMQDLVQEIVHRNNAAKKKLRMRTRNHSLIVWTSRLQFKGLYWLPRRE